MGNARHYPEDDNLYTGTEENIADMLSNWRFEFVRHDITFPLYVEVGEIYKLTCPASPIHCQFDPVQMVKTGVRGLDQHATIDYFRARLGVGY